MESISTVVFIGAGNLATNLAMALHGIGINIIQIVSRSVYSSKILAEKLTTDYTNDLSEINQNADLYIISVTDTALADISFKLRLKNKIVVHTSGTLEMNILTSISENVGVFYPIQTFSKFEIINFSNIPICIESNSKSVEFILLNLAKKISGNVNLISSDQRKTLHISAVFASNYTSFMYLIANEIVKENSLDFNLLLPLIERTAAKLQTHKPEEAITGPSRRNDTEIIKKHLDFLKSKPNYYKIYKLLSNNIINHFYDTNL